MHMDTRDVGREYWDHIGETIPRDFDGGAKLHYTNRANPREKGAGRGMAVIRKLAQTNGIG